MSDTAKAPWHLWVVGVVSLLWNAGGIFSYLATAFGKLEGMAFDAEQVAYFYSFPAWAVTFWALGVWGSFLGSVALLLRKSWATLLFGISLVGLAGTTYFERVVAEVPERFDTPFFWAFSVAIWVVTLLLMYYSRRMTASGVLR